MSDGDVHKLKEWGLSYKVTGGYKKGYSFYIYAFVTMDISTLDKTPQKQQITPQSINFNQTHQNGN
jgi:hypothetical protein